MDWRLLSNRPLSEVMLAVLFFIEFHYKGNLKHLNNNYFCRNYFENHIEILMWYTFVILHLLLNSLYFCIFFQLAVINAYKPQ